MIQKENDTNRLDILFIYLAKFYGIKRKSNVLISLLYIIFIKIWAIQVFKIKQRVSNR